MHWHHCRDLSRGGLCEVGKQPPWLDSPTMPLCRFVIQLLEDLVFFVSDVPNNGQNVLDIVVTKPNRERQKLMREQNILKQVSGHGALHPSKAEVLRTCPVLPRAMLDTRDLEAPMEEV